LTVSEPNTASAVHSCALCGLPAGRDPLTQKIGGQEYRFCCLGCLNVFAILSESGLAGADFRDSELYRESLRLGLISNAAPQISEIPEAAERRDATFQLSGLWCTSCGWLIEHGLRRERGVVSAEVLFTSDLLKVTFCPQYVPTGTIERRVAALGYRAAPYTGDTAPAQKERRDLLLRLGIAAALWMNVMLFSLVIYASYFGRVADSARRLVPVVLMVLATPAIFYSGWPILRIGWQSVRRATIRMETLISAGVLAAYGYSVAQIFRPGFHYYFDTACAIVTLVLAGKAMERGAKARTIEGLSLLHRELPKKARVVADGREHFVTIDAITPGMSILVKPGERIPADGVVEEGHSSVEESLITGESRPVEKRPSDATIGGSHNGAGVLRIRVSRAPAESTLAQIVRTVEGALAKRTGTERLVDRLSRIFVPAVLGVACLTFVFCAMSGVPEMDAVMRAIAVLVIACPCALGIATPLATTAAVGAASRKGILLRDPAALEAIRKLDVLVLDKTGTATQGRFRIHETWWSGQYPEAPQMLAALESNSEHPIGRAILEIAPGAACSVAGTTIHKASGISAEVNGLRIAAGNRALMRNEGARIDGAMEARAQGWEREGMTVVFCAIAGNLCGALALGDKLRADSAGFVETLRAKGIRVVLCSGDAAETTAQVAAQLGIDDFQSEVSPQDKMKLVQQYRSRGQVVAMVGDGINDAPALATSDLGIAMGSGTDLALHSAPVVMLNDSLGNVAAVIDLAERTHRIIRANLFWALIYNVAGIALAASGTLNPIFSAAAMVLSSLCVIGNSLRLSRDTVTTVFSR
jgi:Cu2+-exporting ATPase